MIRILFGIFVTLHGLVHLLYFGQSTRRFELQPGMVWPDGSWVFSRFLGTEAVRNLGGILLILSAIGLVAGGIGIRWGRAGGGTLPLDQQYFRRSRSFCSGMA